MNVRIKELMSMVDTDVSGKWINVNNVEKLAELVVKECVNVVIMTSDRYRKEYFADKIKEHFGVE